MTTSTTGVAPEVLASSRRGKRFSLALKEYEKQSGRSLAFFRFGLIEGASITGTEWEAEELSHGPPPYIKAKPLVEAALRKAGIGFTSLTWTPSAGPSELDTGWYVEGGECGYNYWIDAPEPEGVEQ